MRKLEIQEPKKIYWFTNKNNQRLKKFSGDEISEGEIREFEIPDYLLEKQVKNKEKNNSQEG